MLMNHKNFTQIPKKLRHDFFKKSKNHVFRLFWPFLVIFTQWGFFPKKSGSVTHNYIWAPNTMLSFRKKLISQFRENLLTARGTDRMEGWMERWMDPILKNPSCQGWESKETLVEWFWWVLVLLRLANLCQISKLVIVQGCLVQYQQNWVVNPNDKFLFNSGWQFLVCLDYHSIQNFSCGFWIERIWLFFIDE